ncbi:DUF5131 family protein [Entomomonas moraniae]|uniref:DUF5131 family protein n=1 Tax=Entomomonas moraniae TaxID=2213226 RepID=UPI001E53BFB3|nr:DUF5131 family protein [Entomomonas moraniae]
MATKSKIEWTERTWNPIVGCTKVSPGCNPFQAISGYVRLHKVGSKICLLADK